MRRRPSFSATLVALVVLVTGITGAVLGGLAWLEKRSGAAALTDVAMRQAVRLTAEYAERFFTDAAAAARQGPLLVAQGVVSLDDAANLERYLLGVLRAHHEFMWASYGDRAGWFVGAWRDDAGQVYVNRTSVRQGRVRLEEFRLDDNRRRTRVRASDDYNFLPRERPWFKAAEAENGLAWTEPYKFYSRGIGITCAAPVFDEARVVRGVFNVDLSLDALSAFLEDLRITRHAGVFIVTANGTIIAPARPSGARWWPVDAGPDDAAVFRRIVDAREEAQAFTHQGDRLLARTGRFSLGSRDWQIVVVAPERDFTEQIDAQAQQAAMLGGVALILAAGAGIGLSRWISRPLRALGAQARRIRGGDLDVSITPDSRDEIGALAQTMAEMVQGLRDRDFIRDVLGRYVSPELAEQCLSDRDSVRLGGEIRRVSILMSDLRGFSALSERLGPEKMIGLLNRYLAHMVPVILSHHGTINEFIGDAILVLFGAPIERPDDAERSVRCAWAMQRAMVEFNAASFAQGLPELTMGIGLHTGRVVAGNIGSPDRVKYGVVGPAVNLTARIESLTVGPQVLLSQEVLDRVKQIASVGPPREAALKGIAEAVVIYELQGVAGEQGPAPVPLFAGTDVDLDAECYWVDGKRVIEPPHHVRISRLDLQRVQFEADDRLPDDVLDVKLVIHFGDGRSSRGCYARIATRRPLAATSEAGSSVEAVFTALEEADRERIAATIAA